jgi:hypothetical protein
VVLVRLEVQDLVEPTEASAVVDMVLVVEEITMLLLTEAAVLLVLMHNIPMEHPASVQIIGPGLHH